MKNSRLYCTAVALLACSLAFASNAADPPKVGAAAPDFALTTLDGKTVCLSDLTTNANVALVVLRGWPGYQCPFCTRQVNDYVAAAHSFAEIKAPVIFVYPGPADDLKAHAKDFLGNKDWPKDFTFVMDPAYSMVKDYGLRWDAPGETAYPSTFVIDRKGMVRFEKISHAHGDRTKAADIVAELKRLPGS